MKSLTPYLIVFLLLVIGATYLAHADPITGAVAEAHASSSTGSVRFDILNEAFALIFHLTTGGIIVTAVMWLIVEGGKLYRRYWIDRNTRRWQPGPNAYYRQQQPRMPKLTREDIMLMMLGNQGRVPGLRQPRYPRTDQEAENEIDIDF